MKIGIVQLNYRIGDFDGNFEKMKTTIEAGIAANADLLLFSELSVLWVSSTRDFYILNILFINVILLLNN